ncbi:type IV secretion protein Rhs [Escherichia marmotae]|uniref:type IV secretion protein Rhs n=1 Tax=Escherichia marmotae TaxID=1499973 RepID=UPI00164F4939|nr:type IV secretion protein Rhs [Escherichia marmotae]MBY7469859.1 type IV secretion protein Rhs [Escherichia marmotae]MED0063791.1 type IV secretion protein Rhs [Escherichia marmotae]
MILDDEIKEKIAQQSDSLLIIDDWTFIADELSDSFEWIGSKINWSRTRKHECLNLKGNNSDWFDKINKFIHCNNIDSEILHSDNIYYINDSSLDFSVSIKPEQFYFFLKMAIENIPQHHYFFNREKKWCVVISSEGYIDFGFSMREYI